MKSKLLLLLVLFITATAIQAQHPTCDGNRYKNYSFIAIDSTKNVQFGQNYTMNNVLQNLKMDVYQPHLDAAAKRPLIVFIHGGAFYLGNRQEFKAISMAFAYYGFVTATIDYRLIDVPLLDSNTVAEGMIMAMGDAKAAIRYFVEDAATSNLYKIDTNYIFIAGGSAGGITASHVAYLDPTDVIPANLSTFIANHGGFKGNSSTNTTHTTPIKGVVNYSGALWRREFISAGEPPLYSAHDNLDTIVPCNHGLSDAFSFPVYLNGSCSMQAEATAKGIYNEIFINNSSGHGAYFQSSPLIDTVVYKTSHFLYNIICTSVLSADELQNDPTLFSIYPNPATNTLTIECKDISFEKNHARIYNAIGALVKEEALLQKTSNINTTALPPGFYIIRFEKGNYKPITFMKE